MWVNVRGELRRRCYDHASEQLERGGTVSDERTIAFLDWLTESGRVWFGYESRNGSPESLWLGTLEVRRSDLARVVKGWPGGVGLSQESADELAGLVVTKVSVSEGRAWPISAR